MSNVVKLKPEEVVAPSSDILTICSTDIAEMTGKSHSIVLRDIRAALTDAGVDDRKFASTYVGVRGNGRYCYYLPRKECDLVTRFHGYSHSSHLAIIKHWASLEVARKAPEASTQVSANSDSLTMSSLEIAELTGKDHADVLKDIRNVLAQAEIDDGKFSGIYQDSRNRDKPCYNLPKLECDLVVSGYSVKYRLAIIKRWHELEARIKAQEPPTFSIPTTLHGALLLAAKLEEEKQLALTKIEEDAPKVAFHDAVAETKGMMVFSIFAKSLELGRNNAYKWARDNGLFMQGNLPYQKWIDAGFFFVKEAMTPTNKTPYPIVLVTGKGQIKIQQMLQGE